VSRETRHEIFAAALLIICLVEAVWILGIH
jgi:F0F1-type ATP synthase membrane subunit c/vacuolar-type H+-ATPase subunit K